MSNILLIKALAVVCRDHFQARNDLGDGEVAMIAASAYEGAQMAFERIRATRTAMGALANGAGTYHVGETVKGGEVWRQITNRPRSLEEARQMAMLAPDGRVRMVSDFSQIERMVERGEWERG